MISQNIILKARNANLPEFLTAKGCKLIKEGRQFRVEGVPGLVVTENRWYDHARQQGGNALDYLIHLEGAAFKDAIVALADYYGDTNNSACGPLPGDRHNEFRLPPKNYDNARILPYLAGIRGIRYDVLEPFISSGRVYEAEGTGNCVFTGIDYDTNEVRYAFQRSSNEKSHIMFETFGSDKRYSFSIPGTSETVLIFEAVIDLLSYLCMEPGAVYSNAFYLSLGGLSSIALDHFIRKWKGVRDIIFCLDGDNAADEAYVRLGARYAAYGYSVSRHIPSHKDWNAQLINGGYSFPAPPVPWGETP